MSVATTALSTFALAAEPPKNLNALIVTAIIAFAAASSWFFLGEYISALKERIRSNQDGISGTRTEAREKAIEVVRKNARLKLYGLLILAVTCSALWPVL
mgnify:CR=1 FL=1